MLIGTDTGINSMPMAAKRSAAAPLENRDNRLCADQTDNRHGADKKKIENYCKLQSFFYTVILFRLIVKGGNGLKALADSESNTHQEHGITIHNAHGGDGSVSKGLGQIIQNTMGDGVQALTDKGREANTQNLENAVGTFCNIRKPDLTLSHSEKENHQEKKLNT